MTRGIWPLGKTHNVRVVPIVAQRRRSCARHVCEPYPSTISANQDSTRMLCASLQNENVINTTSMPHIELHLDSPAISWKPCNVGHGSSHRCYGRSTPTLVMLLKPSNG